jgi:hypothetical protein
MRPGGKRKSGGKDLQLCGTAKPTLGSPCGPRTDESLKGGTTSTRRLGPETLDGRHPAIERLIRVATRAILTIGIGNDRLTKVSGERLHATKMEMAVPSIPSMSRHQTPRCRHPQLRHIRKDLACSGRRKFRSRGKALLV